MRKLLPYKKGKRKSIDLKVPIPLVGGIQNAKLAEWQLDALLTSGQQRPTEEDSTVADRNNRREWTKKAGSTISTIETRPQTTLPARPISSPPTLAMPNPRRLLPPPDLVLRREDLDKTELETVISRDNKDNGNDAHHQDTVVLWPHNWKEIPNRIQQEQILAAGDSNDPWASDSEDYVSALQSPLVSDDHRQAIDLLLNRPLAEGDHYIPGAQHHPLPHLAKKEQHPIRRVFAAQQPPLPSHYQQQHRRQQQQQQQQHNTISLEDLKQQVDMIQFQRVKERHEWERREIEHRQREKEMLDKIQDTQRRLERVLASSSNHNNAQNGIANDTPTDNANGTSFSSRRYPAQEQLMDGEEGDDQQGSHHYYHYYPYIQQQQRPRSFRRSSAPGSPEDGYHSAMEEVADATRRQQRKQRQDDVDDDDGDDDDGDDDDDDDGAEDNDEPVLTHSRRHRRSFMAEDPIPYATFPSHIRRPPPPHAFMIPPAAAVHGGGCMPPPHMLMFDDWPAWPPPPFPPRRRRFVPSTPTTPSTAYPEGYQDEYRSFPYPFLRPPSSSSRMHHRSAGAHPAPVPIFHHRHRSADVPPPPSMGYR